MEGHIPSYGDLIFVTHETPRWGKSAYVKEIAVSGTTSTIVLSRNVPWEEGEQHAIVIRKRDGTPLGPIEVVEGDAPNEAVAYDPIDTDDLTLGEDEKEPPYCCFGTLVNWGKKCVVTRLAPGSDNTVSVTCVLYDERLFAGDAATPPALPGSKIPAAPSALPVVSGLSVRVHPTKSGRVIASWDTSLGAIEYVVESSNDNESWRLEGVARSTSLEFAFTPGDIYVRVAARNAGQGPWSTWSGTATGTTVNITSIIGRVFFSAL
jgi:hypothetical protein